MAIRLLTLALLTMSAFAAYWLARDAMPLVLAWLGEVTPLSLPPLVEAPARIAASAQLTASFGAISFAISLCVSCVVQPHRLARIAGGGARQAIFQAALIVVPAAALWLGLLYVFGLLPLVERPFPVFLAVFAGMMLLPLAQLQVRPLLEAVGVTLAVAMVWITIPAAPYRSIAILVYALALALAYTIVNRRVRSPSSPLGRLIVIGMITVAAHLAWIVCIFLVGLVQTIPIWLMLASAAIMFAVGGLLPLAVAYARSGDILAALLYQPEMLHDPTSRSDPKLWPELVVPAAPSGSPGAQRAWIISYTGISNEPRVLRQCEALLSEGWQVVVCGFDGHSPRPPEWTFIRLPVSDPFGGEIHHALAATRRLGQFLLVRCRLKAAAHLVHGATPLWLHTRLQLKQLARRHPELKADLVVSHDWHSADAGHGVATAYGAKFSVDVHEYAAGQYSYDPEWVRLHRPVTVTVQRRYLRLADVVTVVCQGIGELIAKENGLTRQPTVIRSVPFKAIQPFRPTGEKIEVLYHGDLSQRREIHAAIAAIPLWRQEFHLRLRGSGDAPYLARLKAQITEMGLEDRVIFEPSVPFDQIVPAANRADIGFFSFDGTSPQIRFTLPNKLFEYIMAGLCLCVGDTPEVNRIVTQYGNGKLIDPHSAEAIAATINSLDRATIDACKKASIAAAEELNWPAEKERLLQAYREIL